jgi:hypothetical protein
MHLHIALPIITIMIQIVLTFIKKYNFMRRKSGANFDELLNK